jgi:hypothetical protein
MIDDSTTSALHIVKRQHLVEFGLKRMNEDSRQSHAVAFC